MNAPLRLSPAEQTLIDQLRTRDAAEADRFAGSGLPTRKVESYHYTDLKMLLRTVPGLAAPVETNTAAPLDVPGARRLSIVNGKPQPAFNLPQGVRVDTVPG